MAAGLAAGLAAAVREAGTVAVGLAAAPERGEDVGAAMREAKGSGLGGGSGEGPGGAGDGEGREGSGRTHPGGRGHDNLYLLKKLTRGTWQPRSSIHLMTAGLF